MLVALEKTWGVKAPDHEREVNDFDRIFIISISHIFEVGHITIWFRTPAFVLELFSTLITPSINSSSHLRRKTKHI